MRLGKKGWFIHSYANGHKMFQASKRFLRMHNRQNFNYSYIFIKCKHLHIPQSTILLKIVTNNLPSIRIFICYSNLRLYLVIL